MRNIFIFCAGSREAQANFTKTILNPIPASVVMSSMTPDRRGDLEALHNRVGGFFAWAFRDTKYINERLKKMQLGDVFLGFFSHQYHALAQVVAIEKNKALGKAIWGEPPEFGAWNHVVFLTKPQKVGVLASDLIPYLCKRYQGATRISDWRIDKIQMDFGSVEKFIEKRFGVSLDWIPAELPIKRVRI